MYCGSNVLYYCHNCPTMCVMCSVLSDLSDIVLGLHLFESYSTCSASLYHTAFVAEHELVWFEWYISHLFFFGGVSDHSLWPPPQYWVFTWKYYIYEIVNVYTYIYTHTGKLTSFSHTEWLTTNVSELSYIEKMVLEGEKKKSPSSVVPSRSKYTRALTSEIFCVFWYQDVTCLKSTTECEQGVCHEPMLPSATSYPDASSGP